MYISPYRCIQQGHRLEWFKEFTKKDNLSGAWFYCKKCCLQSPWISWQNLPSDVDWHLLHEMTRRSPTKVRFASKENGEPTDLSLFKHGLITCPPPAPPEPQAVPTFWVKAGIYKCLDENHNVRFHYWNWMSGYTRVWFACKDCKLNSNWIYLPETTGFSRLSITRKYIRPGTKGYAHRTGGLPVTPVNDTTPMVRIALIADLKTKARVPACPVSYTLFAPEGRKANSLLGP